VVFGGPPITLLGTLNIELLAAIRLAGCRIGGIQVWTRQRPAVEDHGPGFARGECRVESFEAGFIEARGVSGFSCLSRSSSVANARKATDITK
jgi:hypothetical protein